MHPRQPPNSPDRARRYRPGDARVEGIARAALQSLPAFNAQALSSMLFSLATQSARLREFASLSFSARLFILLFSVL